MDSRKVKPAKLRSVSDSSDDEDLDMNGWINSWQD